MARRTRPMSKQQFRIGELAGALDVERSVVRFWEKEFDVTTDRSQGGQRFYTSDDLQTFKKIKTLLYEQGYTINGARKQLARKVVAKTNQNNKLSPETRRALLSLKNQLQIVRNLILEAISK